MARYEQIGFERVIGKAIRARKKLIKAHYLNEPLKYTQTNIKNQTFFQPYLDAFKKLRCNIQSADNYEIIQHVIEETAVSVFFESLKAIELSEKSIKKNWDHIVRAAISSTALSGLAAFTYFAPIAAAGTVAV